MKKDAAIRNINSFAEFYLQIEEKYRKDYHLALCVFRRERIRYTEELKTMPGLRVISSQANYIMAEVRNGMTAAELTKILIAKYHILIKK